MFGHGTSALLAAILVGSFLVRFKLVGREVQHQKTPTITESKFLVNFQQVMFSRNVDDMQTCKSVTNL